MSFARLTIALSLSIALIGGALWYRFVRIAPYTADIAPVQRPEQFSDQKVSLEYFSEPVAKLPATSTEPLTPTAIISQQLFSDYIELKSQGRATPDNLKALAEHYAENLVNFDLSIPKVNPNQIILLPDSEENLMTYGKVIANMRARDKSSIASQIENKKIDFTNINSPTFSTFTSTASKLYQTSADEMLFIGVPAMLADNHLNLINQYLETAEVLKSFSNIKKDPLEAMPALNIYAKNNAKESELLLNIQKTLAVNGIILDIGI